MTYRERREARAEQLSMWAEKREEKAEAATAKARDMASVIPFGQPILAGHYSEGRDRRYRERIGNTFDKAREHEEKARDMASRARGIESQLAGSIYSDDPDAVEALEARIAALEAERERIKAYNASCRKAAKTGGTGDRSLLTEAERADLLSLAKFSPYQIGKGGALPAYKLSNLSGNIKRNRDRLAEVRELAERRDAVEAAGGVLVERLTNGYVRVTFEEKPDRDTLDELKAAGFRWSRPSWVGQADALPEGIEA